MANFEANNLVVSIPGLKQKQIDEESVPDFDTFQYDKTNINVNSDLHNMPNGKSYKACYS